MQWLDNFHNKYWRYGTGIILFFAVAVIIKRIAEMLFA